MNSIIKEEKVKILDVGAGENVAAWFIHNQNASIYTVDIEDEAIRKGKDNTNAFTADGRKLPFRSDSFEIVLSVGSLEHIPVKGRDMFLSELKRVAKRMVIVYAPVDDEPLYAARATDIRFAKEHKKIYGYEEKNTAEHISSGGWVGMTLLRKHFPTASFTPMHNCNIWLAHMLNSFRPDPLILLNGFIYLIKLKKYDKGPPYFACKVVYNKKPSYSSLSNSHL